MAETTTSAPSEQNKTNNGLTPEQLRQVMDKVYALLLQDLKIERERARKR